MKNFTFPITLIAYLFALPGLTSRLYAESLPANDVIFCLPLNYEDLQRRDSLYAATKHALNLNVGAPRTVRMIYFLPNDRQFSAEVNKKIKDGIRQSQTFYAVQMRVHGYGNKTFRFETDAQGEPLVHLVKGKRPESAYYINTSIVFDEIEEMFDVRENIYFITVDHSRWLGGLGTRRGKTGGMALGPGSVPFVNSAHELGHAFGLFHDFSDGAYIMSYGPGQDRLSACHAKFLTRHPYFNASIPEEQIGRPPVIQLISPTEYTVGSKNVPVELIVYDRDLLNQVFLFVITRPSHSAAGGFEVKECLGFPYRQDYGIRVTFNYDGVIPSNDSTSIWNPATHPIFISAVDTTGNWNYRELELICKNCPLMLKKNSGENQQGVPGTLLADPLMVEVRDMNGAGIEGIPVTFKVTAGNGLLSGMFSVEHTTTDASGRAQIMLMLGPSPGTNTVEVSVTGLDPVTFNATGVGTSAILIRGGEYQTWHLPDDVIVRLGKGSIAESDRAVAFSPDGQYLAVASGIGIWLYEVATSHPFALLPTAHVVHSVVFSPDGSLLALGLDDGKVELWLVETISKIATFEGHTGRINTVAFSPNRTLLASGSGDHTVKLWDVATRRNIATLEGHTDWINTVAFSPNGTLLASGSWDNTVKLWDVATRRNIATLERHTDWINTVAFSPNGTLLASGSGDNTVKLWDVATRRNIATLEHTTEVNAVAFSPNDTILVSGIWNEVKLWDVAARRNIATLEEHTGRIIAVAFSPNGALLASGSSDGTVKLRGIETRNTAVLSGHITLRSMAFSPNGTLLASGSEDNTVKLWDVATRHNIATLEGHTGRIIAVAFSPNGALLASGSSDGTVKLWDVATRHNIATLEHTTGVNAVAFSPNGALLASGSWDHTVKLWDVATRRNIATLEGHGSEVNAVAFSPNGTLLASGSWDHTVKLWDVATRRNIATLEHTTGVNAVAFSPNDTILVSGIWNEVKLWDVATRRNIATLEHTTGVNAVAFSHDGATLASGAWRKIDLWDVATRHNIATLEGHTGSVNAVSFSSDGTTLASGSSDGTMLMWNMSSYITPTTPTQASTPDFNGDRIVDFSDFLLFAAQFGLSQDDEGYETRFDLDADGMIGFGDFLIFANNFGKKVS